MWNFIRQANSTSGKLLPYIVLRHRRRLPQKSEKGLCSAPERFQLRDATTKPNNILKCKKKSSLHGNLTLLSPEEITCERPKMTHTKQRFGIEGPSSGHPPFGDIQGVMKVGPDPPCSGFRWKWFSYQPLPCWPLVTTSHRVLVMGTEGPSGIVQN